MIKCLLVASSKVIDGFAYFLTLPNGGLPSIAANVNRKICDVKVMDLVAVRYKAKKYFKQYIEKNNFDVIGFSCMVFQYAEMLELARLVKSISPKTITVLGGYYATVNYEETLQSADMQYFDIVVRGEGEVVFRDLVQAIHDVRNYESVPGISYIKDGNIIRNPRGELIDLNAIKLPDRDSRIFGHRKFRMADYPADVVETSRGCTFTCKYCTITKMYGRSYRKFGIERILDDIQDAKDHGARAVLFTDDNIVLNKTHFEELCHGIIRRGLNDIKYATQASVQGFIKNPHLPALMRQAGFDWVFLGIESDSDEALEFFSKDNQLKSSEAEIVVKALRENNMFVIGGLIVGNPSDNRETLNRTYEFAKKISLDFTIFFTLTPYPGTELREELLAGNYVTNKSDYSLYDCYNVNVRTDYLNSYELFEAIDSMIQKYYIDSGAFERVLRRYPVFFVKSLFRFLYRHPDMVFHHLTKGRFLARKRRKKFALRTQLVDQYIP